MSPQPGLILDIVAFDGAGIYGLTQALWMQWLIEREPNFLRWPIGPEATQMFAGTSSGAVNALLFARHPQPREHIRNVVEFWYERESWTNRYLPDALTSLLGLTAWYGTTDFKQTLQRYFGDMRMGELSYPVVVTIYDLFNAQATGKPNRTWTPRVLTNFEVHDPDCVYMDVSEHRVVDIAYAATTVPALRAVEGGWVDGGFVNADPCVQAILLACVYDSARARQATQNVAHTLRELIYDPRRLEKAKRILEGLNHLRVLSVGDGSPETWYHRRDFNYGQQWSLFPSNLADLPGGIWPAPIYTSLSPGIEMSNQLSLEICEGLLRDGHFFRLDPPIATLPISTTVYVCRSWLWWQWLLQNIERGVGSQRSTDRLSEALMFIRATEHLRSESRSPAASE